MQAPANAEPERNPKILFKIRSSLACVPCRSKHVKCDARKPVCERCTAGGRSCHYVTSRRGLKHSNVVSPTDSSESEPFQTQNLVDPNLVYQRVIEGTATSVLRNLSMPIGSQIAEVSPTREIDVLAPETLGYQESQRSTQTVPESSENSTATLLELYFTFFHYAHPYIPPRRAFHLLLQTKKSFLENLLLVMEFIASTYTTEGQSPVLKQRAIDAMSRNDLPKTGFTVQALLLLSSALHCCSGFELARSLLDKATIMALQIGMQHKSFAESNGEGDAVLEESWRRTWWGMYVVDAVFQAIRRSSTFALWHVATDVDLPCEEVDYETKVSLTHQEFAIQSP